MPCAPNSRAFAASSGLSAFARTFRRRTSSAQPRTVSKSSLICGGTSGDLADDHAAGAAVDRDRVALAQLVAADAHASARRRSISSPSQPATHGLPMPRATTAACEVMPPCAVSTPFAWIIPWMSSGVVSQPTRITDSPRLAALLGGVGVEDDRAARRARRRVEPARRDLELGLRVEHRVQQLVELRRVDARDRLLARDQPLRRHVDRRLQRGRGGALRRARLQEVERAVLDRELDVLHVAVVLLEPRHRLEQLVERLRQPLAHLLDRLRRADAGDDVLALRVHEELAVEAGLAGRRVAREADAGRRAVALVAEHHLHDVHGRADVVRDAVRAPVDLRARVLPRLEDREHRAAQLLARVLREVAARSRCR